MPARAVCVYLVVEEKRDREGRDVGKRVKERTRKKESLECMLAKEQ